MAREMSGDTQVLVIDLGGSEYGIYAKHVKEIARIVAMTPVPEAPSFISGTIDYRGEMILVVDLMKRLGMGTAEAGLSSLIIVLDVNGKRVGLLVDTVLDVLSIGTTEIMGSAETSVLPDEVIAGAYSDGDRLLILLDAPALLNFTEVEILKPAGEA